MTKMLRYTLRTETKANLPALTSEFFNAFTLLTGIGVWRGVREDSTSIVILSDANDAGKVQALAARIKTVNKQENVLVETESVNAQLV